MRLQPLHVRCVDRDRALLLRSTSRTAFHISGRLLPMPAWRRSANRPAKSTMTAPSPNAATPSCTRCSTSGPIGSHPQPEMVVAESRDDGVAPRRSMRRAIVALARRLAVSLHRCASTTPPSTGSNSPVVVAPAAWELAAADHGITDSASAGRHPRGDDGRREFGMSANPAAPAARALEG